MKFSIGDRVSAVPDYPSGNMSIRAGDQGTVCQVASDYVVGVRWDSEIEGGHTCSDRCESGHGWRVDVGEIEFAPEEEVSDFDIEDDIFMEILSNA